MKPIGVFLTECGARLARFERRRVGNLGCAAAVVAIGVAALVPELGIRGSQGFGATFRFLVLSALAMVLVVFVLYALWETIVERSVRRQIIAYMENTRTELGALCAAAEIRSDHMAGGRRLLAFLKELPTR